MSFFKCINKGKGPIKLYVGGVHGNEGKTTIHMVKSLADNDFSNGKHMFYNFDETPYISTLNEEYYSSDIGKKIIDLIKKYKPDFYTELHCYNIQNYRKLVSPNRREIQGVPPLIELKNHVLISSVSPLIRKKYFQKETICKTLELPCFNENQLNNSKNSKVNFDSNRYIDKTNNFNQDLANNTYLGVLKLIAKSKSRKDFEKEIVAIYPNQVKLAKKYAKEIFGKDYPPF